MYIDVSIHAIAIIAMTVISVSVIKGVWNGKNNGKN